MSKRSVWRNAILFLAAAALLFVPEASYAQRGGGRGGGGRGGRVASSPGNRGNEGFRGNEVHGYRGEYGGFGYGRGYWLGGIWYPGYWNGGVWVGDPAYDGAPIYDESYYPPPMPYPGTETEQTSAQMGAVVMVRVPDPNAQVWFNDELAQQSGTIRVYHTVALDPNWKYFYTIRARWTANGQPVEQTRKIQVYPGRSVTVEFQ